MSIQKVKDGGGGEGEWGGFGGTLHRVLKDCIPFQFLVVPTQALKLALSYVFTLDRLLDESSRLNHSPHFGLLEFDCVIGTNTNKNNNNNDYGHYNKDRNITNNNTNKGLKNVFIKTSCTHNNDNGNANNILKLNSHL